MRTMFSTITVAAGLMAALASFAQAPAGAPAGTTGLCKDGSYYSGATKRGACSKHGGVKDWYAGEETKPAAPAPAPKKEAAAPKKETAAPTKTTAAAPAPTPAAGGGDGKVWVNTSSKVYHCQGSKYYGKTKQGEYMTEAAAKAAGDHPNHGKSCS